MMPTAGGPWTRFSEGAHWDDKPRWSPDGNTIYFVSGRSGFFNVWGIRFDATNGKSVGEPFRVTAFESPALMSRTRSTQWSFPSLKTASRYLEVFRAASGCWTMWNGSRGQDFLGIAGGTPALPRTGQKKMPGILCRAFQLHLSHLLEGEIDNQCCGADVDARLCRSVRDRASRPIRFDSPGVKSNPPIISCRS